MDSSAHTPQNFEERVIWHAITCTWLYYLVGGLYILAPVLGWILILRVGYKAYIQNDQTPPRERVRFTLQAFVWSAAMLVMLLALILGHINFDLGIPALIKSSVGWAKGWALLAVFVVIGAGTDIRTSVMARAANRLALQTLCLMPIFLLAPILHLPDRLYVSPLFALGGPGPEFFEVQLFGLGADNAGARWQFFSPWAPAAGLVANVYLIFALQDKSRFWKIIGIIAAVMMCLMSQSRLALIALLLVPLLTKGLSLLTRPKTVFVLAAGSSAIGLMMVQVFEFMDAANARFVAARAASSRVRAALGRIAVQRWSSEAPIFGHGTVERGPHIVEYMPIGSHHTWYGLLYVKGAVGFAALAIPMIFSTFELLLKAQTSRTAQAALSMVITIFLYTFGENLEILVYQFWPGIILIGAASRQRFHNPFRKPLARK